MDTPLKDIVVIHHSPCPDGFTAAYVAWRKFGDKASYVPASHGQQPPEGLDGKEVYVIDFSYTKETMQLIERKAKSLTVLDHHKTAEDAVRSLKDFRFALDYSGAGLAWQYFFPDHAMPKIVQYIQEGDLNRSTLPFTYEIERVIYATPFTFDAFTILDDQLETPELFEAFVAKGKAYGEHFKRLADTIAESAELVSFEGYEVYAANVPGVFKHEIAMQLCEKYKKPFGLVWRQLADGTKRISLRSREDVDVTEIAKKYGGGGHKNAVAFNIPADKPLPFTVVTK